MSFFGATGTPVLDFWWRLLWVSKPEVVLPYSHCGGECNVHSPKSTSGATLANLLAAGLLPVLSPHTVTEVRLLGFEIVLSEYLWVRRSTSWAKLGWAFLKYQLRLVQTKLKLQPTGFRLASDSKISVNGTILCQCNPTAFYQSETSLKQIGSQSEASQLQISFWCERGIR